MKTIGIALLFIFISQIAFSQGQDSTSRRRDREKSNEVKTVFGKNRRTGAYGGFSFGYAQIDGIDGLTVGGRGGVIVGQALTIGIAGKGFSTDYSWQTDVNSPSRVVSGGYGGILIEPIIAPRFPVHISLPIVFGAGGMGSYSKYYDSVNQYWRYGPFEGSAFLICEAGAELELNLTRFFRMAIGASYRFSTNKAVSSSVNNNLNGLSIDLVFKFGRF